MTALEKYVIKVRIDISVMLFGHLQISKLNGTPSCLNRVKNSLKKCRILLINALIFSHLNYCSSIWSNCTEKLQYDVINV